MHILSVPGAAPKRTLLVAPKPTPTIVLVRRGQVKCSASELLGLQGLLRHLVETRVAGHGVEAELASFDAACHCIDALQVAKRGVWASDVAVQRLERASAQFLQLHKAAYGTTHMRPKHHWIMDIPAQLRRDGCVLDMFIIERLHLQVKAIAENVRNTIVFERSVLAGVSNLQAQRLATSFGDCGLEGREIRWPGARGVLVAERLSYLGLTVP